MAAGAHPIGPPDMVRLRSIEEIIKGMKWEFEDKELIIAQWEQEAVNAPFALSV